jgi:zinc protease
VQTDKTKESMVEVAKEIAGIAGGRPIAGDELANLMQGTVSRLPGRFETLEALEAAAVAMVHLGYPESYFARYAENARAIGERELAAAGARYVKPDDLVWVVIGDLAKIEAGVRELGYGEIVRLDADGRPVS